MYQPEDFATIRLTIKITRLEERSVYVARSCILWVTSFWVIVSRIILNFYSLNHYMLYVCTWQGSLYVPSATTTRDSSPFWSHSSPMWESPPIKQIGNTIFRSGVTPLLRGLRRHSDILPLSIVGKPYLDSLPPGTPIFRRAPNNAQVRAPKTPTRSWPPSPRHTSS